MMHKTFKHTPTPSVTPLCVPPKPTKIQKVQKPKPMFGKEVVPLIPKKAIQKGKVQKNQIKGGVKKIQELKKPVNPLKQKIPQVKLANLVESISAEKCNYLLDKNKYSMIFFKYKGRVIDIPQMMVEIAVGNKSKEEIVQQIRKSLLWGMKTGDYIYFNIDTPANINQLLKDTPFWHPSKLFTPSSKIDSQWYKQKLVSKIDPSPQQFFPGDYRIILTTTNSLPLKTLSEQLKLDEKQFISMEIV